MSDLLPLLIDSIPSLLQLETLIVAEELMMDCDGIYSKIHQSNIPTIRSESLKKLRTFMIEEFQTLWKSLHPKFTENMYSLELTFEHSYTPAVVGIISDGMNRMSKLQSLSLSGCRKTNSRTILVSYSVKHLKVDYVSDITFAVPELQSFEGTLEALREPYEGVEGGPLIKLKNVTLTGHGKGCSNDIVVYRLAHIEILRLKYLIEEDSIFDDISNTCTALKELYLDCPVFGDEHFFRNLSQLVNLRRLSFDDICIHAESFDLSALSQLTHLKLEKADFDGISQIRLPKSIKYLSVAMCPDNEILENTITGTLIQLQKLCLVYPNPRFYFTSMIVNKETLQSLYRLTQLEELVFVNAKFALSAFLDGIAPVHRLRKLLLVNCNFDRNHLYALKQMFPNLRYLDSTLKYYVHRNF
uniref:Uncharacterized protein n=1 Tax=Anopheles albimanus TaxID=7167 RepID=A0A182FKK0_ANOAL